MRDWVYYAVDALTGEVMDSDLDITVISRTCELSGPGSFVAHADPDSGQLRDSFGRVLLDEWSTLLYAESDGLLRWGGIVHELRYEGPRLVIEAAGLSSYAHGMPFLGSYTATNVDAADVIRMIWAHLQSFDGGNLGVQVVGKAGVLVGDGFTEKMREGAERERNPDGTFKPIREDQKERIPTPYELQWWNSPDCGREVTRLLGDGSFEYAERYEWADAAKTAIKHTIAIAPRIGTYRDKLRFVQGENVIDSTPVTFSGSVWASEVHLIGAGEGQGSLRSSAAVRPPRRLRRAVALPAKAITDQRRLDATTRAELDFRVRSGAEVASITVIQHENAPLESWGIGDVIDVELDVPWAGVVNLTARIVSYTIDDRDETATLSLSPVS